MSKIRIRFFAERAKYGARSRKYEAHFPDSLHLRILLMPLAAGRPLCGLIIASCSAWWALHTLQSAKLLAVHIARCLASETDVGATKKVEVRIGMLLW